MFGKRKKAKEAEGLATMVNIVLMGHFEHLEQFAGISFGGAAPDLREAILDWVIGTIEGCAHAGHMQLSEVDRATLVGHMAPHFPELWMGIAGSLEMTLDNRLPESPSRALGKELAAKITRAAPNGQQALLDAMAASTADLVMHFIDIKGDDEDENEDDDDELVEIDTNEQSNHQVISEEISAPTPETKIKETRVESPAESSPVNLRTPVDESYRGEEYIKECSTRMDEALGGWDGSPIDPLYAALWKPDTPLSQVRNDIFREGEEDGFETPVEYAKRVAPGLTDLGLLATVAYRATGFMEELRELEVCSEDGFEELDEKLDAAFDAIGAICDVVSRIVVPEFDKRES